MPRARAADALIDAAERIVAEDGLAKLTLRNVQLMAGQSNKSAVSYHFGGRDELIDAVLADRAGGVNVRRRQLLTELDQQTSAPTTRQLLEALIHPLIDRTLRSELSYYGRFLAQTLQDPVLSKTVERHEETSTYRSTMKQIQRTAGIGNPNVRTDSVRLFVLSSLGYWESRNADPDEIAALLIDTCESIIRSNERVTA